MGEPQVLGEDWPRIESAQEALAFFETHESYALFCIDEGALAGGFGLRQEDDKIWFYYFLLPEYRGKNLSMCALAHMELQAHRTHPSPSLWALCAASNVASIKAMVRHGFHVVDEVDGAVLILCKLTH